MNLYLRCFWLHQRRNFKNVLHILSEDVENQWWSCIIFFIVAQIFKCSSVTKTVLKWMRGDLLPNLKVVSEEQVLSTSQPENSTALQGCCHTDLLINIYHFVCTCHHICTLEKSKKYCNGCIDSNKVRNSPCLYITLLIWSTVAHQFSVRQQKYNSEEINTC